MSRLMMLLLAGMFALPQQGNAQTPNHALHEAIKIQLVIGELGDDERKCGLTEEAIRSTAMYPLSSSKIEVAPKGEVRLGEVALNIRVHTLQSKETSICFSSAIIQALTLHEATLAFSGETMLVPVMLWDDGYVAFSPRGDHANHLSKGIEKEIKKFITDWNLDNKPVPLTRR
jgi:hypothetical protein